MAGRRTYVRYQFRTGPMLAELVCRKSIKNRHLQPTALRKAFTALRSGVSKSSIILQQTGDRSVAVHTAFGFPRGGQRDRPLRLHQKLGYSFAWPEVAFRNLSRNANGIRRPLRWC